MEQEKTLLQQIRDKEQELSIELDKAIKGSEETVLQANREAEDILARARRAGEAAAAEYRSREEAHIAAEVKKVQEQGKILADSAKADGERNLPAAVTMLVRTVAPEGPN